MTRFIKPIALQLTVCAAIMSAVVSQAKADGNIYERTLKSTAWVLAQTGDQTSSGAGVLIDSEQRLLVTNFHVVEDARTAVVFFPEMKKSKPIVDRSHYRKNVKTLGVRSRVVAVDKKRDLALIQLDRLPTGVEAITLSESSVGPGESVQSIGNPGSSGALWVFTSGTVRSAYQKQFSTEVGKHDFMVVESQSPINSGDSGGPVVNSKGELVAISQAISPKANLISYSVDVSEIRTLLASDWKPAPLSTKDVLKKADIRFKASKDGVVEVTLSPVDNKKQVVYVSTDVENFGQADVRRIWALAATLKEAPSIETTTKLLRQAAQTKIGSWSIEKSDDGDYLVIYVCKVDATATPKALASTMEYVARLTTVAKKDLTPKTTTEDPADVLSDWLSN